MKLSSAITRVFLCQISINRSKLQDFYTNFRNVRRSFSKLRNVLRTYISGFQSVIVSASKLLLLGRWILMILHEAYGKRYSMCMGEIKGVLKSQIVNYLCSTIKPLLRLFGRLSKGEAAKYNVYKYLMINTFFVFN